MTLSLSLSPSSLSTALFPPLIYNDQSGSLTVNFGVPGFNLEARNYAGSVTWWYNGSPIPTDGSSQKYSISSDTLILSVLNIVFSDAGLYQAELIDAEPTQFLNFQIDVCKFTELAKICTSLIL